MRPFLKALSWHLLIFVSLSLVMPLILFISGQFTVLHEDAYGDGIMSIVYVYAVILIVILIGKVLKRHIRTHPTSWISKVQTWHEKNGVLTNIAIGFTLITVINSAMMLIGLDVAKTGSFAYLHLLIRLMIVSVAVILWMHKDAIRFFRRFFLTSADRKPSTTSNPMKETSIRMFAHPFEASTALFTLITTVGCLGMLGLGLFVNIQSGEPLYLVLVVLYGVLYISLRLSAFIIQYRSSKRIDTADLAIQNKGKD